MRKIKIKRVPPLSMPSMVIKIFGAMEQLADLSQIKRPRIIQSILLILYSLLVLSKANAASIGLTSGPLPDLTLSNANIDFIFSEAICEDIGGSGDTGVCGTIIDVGGTKNDRDFSGAVTQAANGVLSITGSSMTLEAFAGQVGFWFIENGSYSLTANFDETGLITDASLSILGNVVQDGGADPGNDFQSGTLGASSSYEDFGFQGNNDTGTFEFIFKPSSGDLVDYIGGDTLNVIASGVSTFSALAGFGVWDPADTGDTTLFTQSFSGSGSVDTLVPIPAAAWLFSSAILSLGIVRRKSR